MAEMQRSWKGPWVMPVQWEKLLNIPRREIKNWWPVQRGDKQRYTAQMSGILNSVDRLGGTGVAGGGGVQGEGQDMDCMQSRFSMRNWALCNRYIWFLRDTLAISP